MKRCFYDVLGVLQSATSDEIKKSYRRLALQYHPDKNPENDEEAHSKFLALQEAYETLSDPHERAWYNGHRNQILRASNKDGLNKSDQSGSKINIYRWFRKDCYNGFSESVDSKPFGTKCFYTVYRELFDLIAQEEVACSKDEKGVANEEFASAPSFGNSKSVLADVESFYRFWSGFSTDRSFACAESWNLADASCRAERRAMEVENKKKRKEAKKEFNDGIRALIEFIRVSPRERDACVVVVVCVWAVDVCN